MSHLFPLFLNNLLPIFLAAGSGFLLSKLLKTSPRPLSQVIFYIFSPCLVFTLLTDSQLSDGDIARTVAYAVANILLVGALTLTIGKFLKFDRRILAGTMIAAMFMNAGNFGLPVVLFAFGESALSYASLYFVTNAMMSYSLGVIIASMGSVSLKQAVKRLALIPSMYALVLALIFMRTGWQLPLPLERTTDLLGSASIPGMLVLLGMQLQRADWSGKIKPLLVASGVRLLASPAIALALVPLFGLVGAARQASVLESAMPTAVLTTVLATEFDVEPSFVTSTVFITTLLSPLTLTPLLAFLGA